MRLILSRDSIDISPCPFIDQSCVADEAPQALGESKGAHSGTVGYISGINPEPRPLLPGYNDGVTALVTGIFLLLALSVSRRSNFLKTFTAALLSGRRTGNSFDDQTVAESRITVALLIICCICEGILLFFATTRADYSFNVFGSIALFTGVAAALMIFQTVCYSLTGFAFAPAANDTRQWLRGFFASQALLGLVLLLPALMIIYYPGNADITLKVAATLYVLARLMFIRKGFKFFYTNFFSLVYFILYLCTLEIAPILVLWRLSLIINDFV